MKIALLTTLSGLVETSRIKEEIEKLGHEFVFVDLKGFAYTNFDGEVNLPEMKTLLECDVVIARGIFNSLKSIATLLGYLRSKGVKVFDNNISTHLYSIDKVVDIFKLSLAQVPVPNTVYARSFSEYPGHFDKIGFPLVIKATRMGKGAGVFKFDNKESAEEYINTLQKGEIQAKSLLIQSFIPYVHDLRVLVIGRTMYGMKRIPGEGEFRANFSLGGAVEPFPLTNEIKELAADAIKAVGLEVAGVDILIEENGKMCVLEVNHTPGFEGMEKATNENIGKVYVDYALSTAK
jgi:RimK family alpha-L-glutamate ligase